ncbi:MAG: hypothetical protein AAB797_00440 [Patescibacteria group bacterium]
MFTERAQKYAHWLTMLAIGMLYPTLILALAGQDLAHDPQGYAIGHLAMTISFMVLMAAALFGPITADPKLKIMPDWTCWLMAYGFVGLIAKLFFCIYADHTSAMSSAYIPGAVFCLNMLGAFLIQTWVASEKLSLPLRITLPAHGLFVAWTFFTLTHVADTAFIVISAIAIVATFLIGMPIIFIVDKRLQAEAGQNKSMV